MPEFFRIIKKIGNFTYSSGFYDLHLYRISALPDFNRNNMKTTLFFPVFLFLTFWNLIGISGPAFDNNQNIRLAHQYLYALRPLTAEKLLKSEETRNPQNGYVIYYRLYSEIIGLLIGNSGKLYSTRVTVINQYIEQLKSLPDNSPDYRMLLGEAKVYAGLLQLKYSSKLSGLFECLRGYNLLEENSEKYPLFEPDKKIPGLIQIGVAFMPKILQWGIKILGIKGNPKEGMKKLSGYAKYSEGKPGYEEEALIFTIAAYKLMNQEDALIKMIYQKQEHFKEIALLNYVAATAAIEANDADIAIELLSHITPGKLETSFPPVNYLLGKAKMLRLDADANIPLMIYLKESGGLDYLKSTLYELACYFYISGNNSEYLNYKEQVKEKGRELHNRDIEAVFEVTKAEPKKISLLRADFLVRGGYFKRAEEELKKADQNDTINESEKVQYYYLKGECKRLNNQINQAETAYLKAVALGSNSGNYFAQKALVQCGLMMEKNGIKSGATKYYQLCLHFKAKNNPYTDLCLNRAKGGLIRLSFLE